MEHENNSNNKIHKGIVQPLLTDMYQITMAYGYWISGKMNDHAIFDLFFRKNPFEGEFTIFAGLDECIKFLENFHYNDSDIEYLKQILGCQVCEEFFKFLRQLTVNDVTLYAIDEGSVVFPRVPLMRVEGPLIIVQLLETTLLNLVNYASLMATNAARYRLAAGPDVRLLEFGLRRAQGPDGGLSASKYSYVGGFDGTSNVLAGKMFNIPVYGTLAHAYITSFSSFSDLRTTKLHNKITNKSSDLLETATEWRIKLTPLFRVDSTETSEGELAALISFAIAFPERFVALVDTYNVCKSGLLNFCSVALALNDFGYRAVGIRIDSGDSSYLSNKARQYFQQIAKTYNLSWFAKLTIIASNEINEETILSLNEQGHQIDCFGIGTHLVTCQRQPALGCVYKLVEINGQPRIKLSQDKDKVTIPGRKDAFRLYSASGHALIDLLQQSIEEPPSVGQRILCCHPFEESKRAYVIPKKVERLHKIYWQNGQVVQQRPTFDQIRERVKESLKTLRTDIKRNLNPTPFKIATSDRLYHFLHALWLKHTHIGILS